MFKRFTLHLVLIFAFVFAQIGASVHTVSHIDDFATHGQHDKNQEDKKPHDAKCPLCVSFAGIGSGLPSAAFVFLLAAAAFFASAFYLFHVSRLTHAPYSARAPPALA